jgi:hypothetical protein
MGKQFHLQYSQEIKYLGINLTKDVNNKKKFPQGKVESIKERSQRRLHKMERSPILIDG